MKKDENDLKRPKELAEEDIEKQENETSENVKMIGDTLNIVCWFCIIGCLWDIPCGF